MLLSTSLGVSLKYNCVAEVPTSKTVSHFVHTLSLAQRMERLINLHFLRNLPGVVSEPRIPLMRVQAASLSGTGPQVRYSA